MPGESGLDLLPDVAPLAPHTVTVMVTAVQEFQVAVEALKAGAYDYIVKPLDLGGLRLAVARALKRRRLELNERSRSARVDEEVDRRLTSLERTRNALLRAMCLMAEFRDIETTAHLDHVGAYAHVIADALARDSVYAPFIDGDFLRSIRECAPLHDVGKVALPDKVLLKPGRLTPDEMRLMQKHPSAGRAICAFVRTSARADDDLIEMVSDIAGGHHEWWDGSGYPEGLRGKDIPLSARIVAVADVYDACRSPKVYRPQPIPRDKVVSLIEAGAGSQFDPVVVTAFLRCRDAIARAEQ
jgi:putative two-component system response regulator